MELRHLGGELAGVLRANAVVLGGRPDERLGVFYAGLELVVGGARQPELADLGSLTEPYSPTQLAPAAIFSNAQHVEQRHLDDDGAPQIGMLGHLDAHEQAAVRATHDAEVGRRSDLAANEVLAHGGEVVVDDLALGLEPGFVPGGTELATTADVRQHVDAALLQPEFAGDGVISRRFWTSKPPYAVSSVGLDPSSFMSFGWTTK